MRHISNYELTAGDTCYVGSKPYRVLSVEHREAYIPFVGPPVPGQWFAELEEISAEWVWYCRDDAHYLTRPHARTYDDTWAVLGSDKKGECLVEKLVSLGL